MAEMRSQTSGNLSQVRLRAKLGHGGDRLGQPARHDVLEITQIRIDVQREAVSGHPSADMDSDCGDLALTYPNAGELGSAAGRDAEIGQRIDDDLLDAAHVSAHVAFPLAQINNGIANQLAGSVIVNIAAAVLWEKRNSSPAQHLRSRQKILHMAVPAQGDHVRMLE